MKVEDILGLKPKSNPILQSILDEIETKIGWSSVKESVKEMVKICDRNYELELQGKFPLFKVLSTFAAQSNRTKTLTVLIEEK